MAQGSSGSYYDDYMRSNAMLKHCGEKNTKKLLTDRNAYISFLEVQLERVSAACLTTQTFERRLSELESTQLANDQKVGSLSKVFRLNQEYVEQTTQQTQNELAGHTAKVDAWMDKFSAELERQQPRMTTLEDQFRQCQEYLPRLAETNDAALHDVKHQAEHEIEELKAQVFALETRIEEIQSCQSATDCKVANLADTATHKLNKELALVRSSVSEKSFQLERTVAQLGNDLEQLVHQVDASWRAETSERTGRYEAHVGEMQQRLNQMQQGLEHGNTEVKGVLKKCLDTQHLLSGTVVALQSEVDDVKRGRTAIAEEDSETLATVVEDLRERQDALKNALQLLQACALESQQASEDRCTKLDDRMAAAEDSFEARTDDLRRRMLAALEDVGENIQQGAGMTTERTLQAARKESESHFARAMAFSATLENRLRILEHTVLSLERAAGWNNELFYQDRIRELEERLHRKAQIEEEQRALFPGSSKASSKSSVASSCYVSSFATEEEFKHDDAHVPRRPRTTLKKKAIKRSSKTAQSTGTSKTLKPKSRLQTLTSFCFIRIGEYATALMAEEE
ncbi:hypothetical protein PRIC2_010583 [Phytophthora ramorum]